MPSRLKPKRCSTGHLESAVPQTVDALLSPTLADILSMDSYVREENGRLYFNPHQAALCIEDRLIEAGVRFYYNAVPAAALMADDRLHGAVFGGKPGLFGIEAGVVVDCTLNSVIARTAGVRSSEQSGPRWASYSVELCDECGPDEIAFDESGLSGRLSVHRFFADFEVLIEDADAGPLGYARDFAKVYATAIGVLDKNGLSKFRGADVYFHSGRSLVETDKGNVSGLENMRVIGPMSIAGNREGQLLMADVLCLHKSFPAPEELAADLTAKTQPAEEVFQISGCRGDDAGTAPKQNSFTDPGFETPGTTRRRLVLREEMETLEEDLLIAGCGTSGVGAAYHAGKLGLSPLCMDNALEVGGANTVGGVTNLWFGRKTRAFENFYEECGAGNDALNASPFFKALSRVGVKLLLSTPVCGTGRSGRDLTCVYVISPEGLLRINAREFIDATGDGSLAAWGGAEYTFGSERDGVSSWGSFGNFLRGKPEAARQFLSMVDERSPRDAARFIVAMRRSQKERLDAQEYVHPAFYLAPRTTRHIKGRTTVTYLDLLAGRRFRDGVLRARSNIDTKGTETSNAFKVGFYAFERLREFEFTIPYSALIPVSLENVIVVGKAYSITNDALTMARMQRDLFVLGIVAAEAASLVRQTGESFRTIPIATLQDRLLELGAIEREDIADDDLGFPSSPDELVESLLGCSGYEDSLECSARLALLGRDIVMPLLDKRKPRMTPFLARLLCLWRVKEGVDFVRSELVGRLGGEGLPLDIHASDYKSHMLPDQGFAPLSVLQLNNLALAGDGGVPALIAEIAGKLGQVVDSHAHLWAYTFGVAYAAERVAGADLTDSLAAILDLPVLSRSPISSREDMRLCADIARERRTYLRLCIARALARCGSRKGIACLLDFLDEERASLAVNARNELVAVTGADCGYSREDWERWLEEQGDEMSPTPVAAEFL